jgi:hypothetical protein
MISKERYKDICEDYSIPLFSQYWWMDAVCKEWDVFIAEEKGKLLGVMPYNIGSKMGFRYIIQPILTQTNGIWFNYPDNLSFQEKYAFEEKVSNIFISELAALRLAYFQQSFHYSFTNWLPFYWAGFKQTTRYTYQIDDLTDLSSIENRFSRAKRKHLRKATNLRIINNVTAKQFYDHHCMTLSVKGQKIIYSWNFFEKLYQETTLRNQGAIIAVGDERGTIYAALFIVWDSQSAYNLISTIDLNYRESGASTKVVLEAIRYVSDKTELFDFEGSMIKEVEYSFRQFGTKQVSFSQIVKSNSWVFSKLLSFKKHISSITGI